MKTRYQSFSDKNPEVYRMLVAMARFVKATGAKSYGMKSLFERLRWHFQFDIATPEQFKLNNDFTSFYARDIMAREADLAGFFETRTSPHA